MAAALDLAPGVGRPSSPGGPSDIVDEGREGPAEDGVVGNDVASEGTRFERIRIGGFLGGTSDSSTAVAGRAGGGGPGEGAAGARAEDIPGDAV